MISIEGVLAEATKNDRVCPQPQKWNELYKLLPNTTRKGSGSEPSLPLILAAWHHTSSLEKAIRLKEHLEWAANHNVLEKTYSFIASFEESDWHHYSE